MIRNALDLSSKHIALERGMKNLVAKVDGRTPSIRWHFEVYGTEFFPFRAYALAVRGVGPSSDEVLVIGLQCHRPGGSAGQVLEFYADVSREDGTILAESERHVITTASPVRATTGSVYRADGPDQEAALDHRINSVIRSLQRWLTQQLPLINMALSSPVGSDLDRRLEALSRLRVHAARVRREMSGKRRPTSLEIIRQAREAASAA